MEDAEKNPKPLKNTYAEDLGNPQSGGEGINKLLDPWSGGKIHPSQAGVGTESMWRGVTPRAVQK